MPIDVNGHVDRDRIDDICRSTKLGAALVELVRSSEDPAGNRALTTYAAELMLQSYLELVDAENKAYMYATTKIAVSAAVISALPGVFVEPCPSGSKSSAH